MQLFYLLIVLYCCQFRNCEDYEGLQAANLTAFVSPPFASNNMFPWMVALYLNDTFVCSGSIISKDIVLTAAQCMFRSGEQQSAESFHGIVGHVSASSGDVIKFQSFVIHEDFKDDVPQENNIAVLRTSEDIPLNYNNIAPLPIAIKSTVFLEGVRAVAMGWEPVSLDGDSQKTVLRFDSLKIMSDFHCQNFIPGLAYQIICATGTSTEFFSRMEFSGIPLVYNDSVQPLQLGIAFYKNNVDCMGLLCPLFFTRVSAYHEWILKVTHMAVL